MIDVEIAVCDYPVENGSSLVPQILQELKLFKAHYVFIASELVLDGSHDATLLPSQSLPF